MSKEKKAELLTSTARSAIASAIVDAIAANESSGSLVTHACNVAMKYANGKPIAEEDRDAITISIGKARGWNKAAFKVRKSECNSVLKTYAYLPEAEKAFRKASGGVCQWTDMLAMARAIAKGKTVTQAVTKARTKGGAGEANPQGRCAGALSMLFDAVRGDKRAAVVSAMRKLTEAGVLTLKGKTAEKFANA